MVSLNSKIGIIGAGTSGVYLAILLIKQGFKVTLFDFVALKLLKMAFLMASHLSKKRESINICKQPRTSNKTFSIRPF